MTGADAAAVFKALALAVRLRADVLPDELVSMVVDATGGTLDRRTPAARRQKRWRDKHRRNEETSIVTPNRNANRNANRNERNAGETPDVTLVPPGPPQSRDLGLGSGSSPDPDSSFLSASSGSDGKRARSKPSARWRRVPESWEPSERHREIARELRLDFERELSLFRDHEFATARSDADAAFRVWLRRANDFAGPRQGGAPRGPQPKQPNSGWKPPVERES